MLAPDGVPIRVAWHRMVRGASVFIPCVNVVACGQELNEIATMKKWQIEMRVKIEGGRWGVRVWRIL